MRSRAGEGAEKVRTRWAFQGSYRALTHTFRVRTARMEDGLRLDRLLAPFRSDAGPRVPTYTLGHRPADAVPFTVHVNGSLAQQARSPEPIVDWILWDVTRQAIEGTDEFLLIHAGAASHEGKGILFPGPTESGKTTLMAGLVAAGFDYLTDEAALVDPGSAWIQPFPRPLRLRPPSVAALARLTGDSARIYNGSSHIGAEDLRSGSVGKPCPVRFVISPKHEPGAATVVEPVSRATALIILAENSFNLATLGAAGHAALAAIVRGASCYRLRMGDLESAVREVRGIVAGKPRADVRPQVAGTGES